MSLPFLGSVVSRWLPQGGSSRAAHNHPSCGCSRGRDSQHLLGHQPEWETVRNLSLGALSAWALYHRAEPKDGELVPGWSSFREGELQAGVWADNTDGRDNVTNPAKLSSQLDT